MKINTGIFWFVDGEMVWDFSQEKIGGNRFVDYPKSHFAMWDYLRNGRFEGSDFATYPRGRVLYDTETEKYKVYADRCITDDQIREVLELMEVGFVVWQRCFDEHYSCDKCIGR